MYEKEEVEHEAMRNPTSITIDRDSITVDGVTVPLSFIAQLLYQLAHPDPRKWYRWERLEDTIEVHVRMSEDSNGSVIASTDARSSSKGVGSERQETPST